MIISAADRPGCPPPLSGPGQPRDPGAGSHVCGGLVNTTQLVENFPACPASAARKRSERVRNRGSAGRGDTGSVEIEALELKRTSIRGHGRREFMLPAWFWPPAAAEAAAAPGLGAGPLLSHLRGSFIGAAREVVVAATGGVDEAIYMRNLGVAHLLIENGRLLAPRVCRRLGPVRDVEIMSSNVLRRPKRRPASHRGSAWGSNPADRGK
jgi:hypothetical protein